MRIRRSSCLLSGSRNRGKRRSRVEVESETVRRLSPKTLSGVDLCASGTRLACLLFARLSGEKAYRVEAVRFSDCPRFVRSKGFDYVGYNKVAVF